MLSMHTETKAEVLAALREVYDGAWTRHLGSDGGRTLAWKGKVGLLFGATGVIDSPLQRHRRHGRSVSAGRLAPAGRGQFDRALKHVGAGTKRMRKELAEAVARLFAGRRSRTAPDRRRRDRNASTASSCWWCGCAARSSATASAAKSRRSTAPKAPRASGWRWSGCSPAWIRSAVERELALSVVKAVALDSVPPARRRAYEHLHALRQDGREAASTTTVAEVLALPSVTTRRVLEDLTAYGLIERRAQGQGKADLWAARDWEREL